MKRVPDRRRRKQIKARVVPFPTDATPTGRRRSSASRPKPPYSCSRCGFASEIDNPRGRRPQGTHQEEPSSESGWRVCPANGPCKGFLADPGDPSQVRHRQSFDYKGQMIRVCTPCVLSSARRTEDGRIQLSGLDAMVIEQIIEEWSRYVALQEEPPPTEPALASVPDENRYGICLENGYRWIAQRRNLRGYGKWFNEVYSWCESGELDYFEVARLEGVLGVFGGISARASV